MKSRQWFQGECSNQIRDNGPLLILSKRAMDLGPNNMDNTTGHILQAIGASQVFFSEFPNHLGTVRRAPTDVPFALTGTILSDWLKFFSQHTGKYGSQRFGYSWDTLRNILTKKYGGKVTGGGGGDNEFEIAFRLVAHFLR